MLSVQLPEPGAVPLPLFQKQTQGEGRGQLPHHALIGPGTWLQEQEI